MSMPRMEEEAENRGVQCWKVGPKAHSLCDDGTCECECHVEEDYSDEE